MDRTLRSEIYARAHRSALTHFTRPPDEDSVDELTVEYFEDEYPEYLHAGQAHLEISSAEDEPDNESTEQEEDSGNEETADDNNPDEKVSE